MNLSLKAWVNKVTNRLNDIGAVYTASWTASSTNGNNQQVTGTITLPKGVYILNVTTPVMSTSGLFGVNGLPNRYTGVTSGSSSHSFTVTVTSNTQSFYVQSGMSGTVSYTYLERGSITAVRIR